MPVVLRPLRSLPAGSRRRVLVGGAAVAVVLVGSVFWAGRRASGASGYRTATAATRSIEEVLTRVGTIEPVSQATVGFPVDGTVASVDVAVGDTVVVGQTLAGLDVTALRSTLLDKQAALDEAELNLERALAGEDVSSGGSGSRTPGVDGAAWSGALVVTPAVVREDPELTAAQQAVLAAQQQVDTDLALAQQALDDATLICAAIGDGTSSDPATMTACRDALDALLTAQETLAASQDALVTAADALDDLLAQRAAELASPPEDDAAPADGDGSTPTDSADAAREPSDAGGATDGAPSGGGSGSISSESSSSSSASSPSSQELIALQKAVDAAAADVAVALQALDQASVVSPIAGTVQAVTVAAGDAVTAGDSATSVVVVGAGGYEVSTTVTVEQLPDLEVGQPATITPDGADEPLEGEVVSIGVAGTAGESTTTYPVVVSVTDGGDGTDLRNGTTASLAIVTAGSEDVLAVPTSAVRNEGGTSTVTVLGDDGGTESVTVQLGAVGDVWTEIVEGLEPGQEVVLADLDAPLPSTATEGSSTTTGGIEIVRPGSFGGFVPDR